MKLHQALAEVAKTYIPGVAKFYQGMNPDPWQDAHDQLEAAVKSDNEDAVSAASLGFVARCKALIKQFQDNGKATHGISAADAFHLGSEDRLRRRMSLKKKACAYCEGTEALKIKADPENETMVVVVCGSCAEKRSIA